MRSQFILEYRYEDDTEWRFEAQYDSVGDVQRALVRHVNKYHHIWTRVRKVSYVKQEKIVGEYNPIATEDYDDE